MACQQGATGVGSQRFHVHRSGTQNAALLFENNASSATSTIARAVIAT
jgi:hypothetical protein